MLSHFSHLGFIPTLPPSAAGCEEAVSETLLQTHERALGDAPWAVTASEEAAAFPPCPMGLGGRFPWCLHTVCFGLLPLRACVPHDCQFSWSLFVMPGGPEEKAKQKLISADLGPD